MSTARLGADRRLEPAGRGGSARPSAGDADLAIRSDDGRGGGGGGIKGDGAVAHVSNQRREEARLPADAPTRRAAVDRQLGATDDPQLNPLLPPATRRGRGLGAGLGLAACGHLGWERGAGSCRRL